MFRNFLKFDVMHTKVSLRNKWYKSSHKGKTLWKGTNM